MKKFNPWAYIRKFQYLIVAFALLAGIVFYTLVIPFQTYTASAIIEYTNEGASTGLAPDGTEIDTSEIYSVSVMQGVFERMGLDYSEYNLDEFRSRVSVAEIRSEEEIAIQEAQNSQGEEAESKPTKYRISFTGSYADARNPKEFTRQVLDNLIDVYLAEYASWQCAQRIPFTLFAAIDIPIPVLQIKMPRSHAPLATASAAGRA